MAEGTRKGVDAVPAPKAPGRAGLLVMLAPPVRFGGALLVATGAAVSAALAFQATSPPTPTFRSDVEYVEVDALVTDEQGRFVPNLQKDDFRIFEDGKQQT